MADSILSITVGLHEEPASVAERVLRASEDASAREGIAVLQRLFGGLGVSPRAKVVARVDSVTRGTASQTVAVVAADGTAGDTLTLNVPGWKGYVFTAVATGGTAASGEYSLDAGSDTLVAQELRDAINSVMGHLVVATESSGTVTITALQAGTWAHSITLAKSVTTGTALTLGGSTLAGGDDVLDRAEATVTLGGANITANDTIQIGGVVLTWVVSPSTEDEVAFVNTAATDAAALVAKINAHSRLQGLVSASNSSGVVTIAHTGDPREGSNYAVEKTETNSGAMALSAARLTAGTTLAYQASPRTYGRGAA